MASIWRVVSARLTTGYRHVITRDSVKGHFALSLGPHEAVAAAVAYFINVPVKPANTRLSLQGILMAWSFERGDPSTAKPMSEGFEALRNDISKWWSGAKSEVNTELTEAARSRKDIAEFQRKLTADIDAIRAEHAKAVEGLTAKQQKSMLAAERTMKERIVEVGVTLNEARKTTEERLTAIEKTYDEKLALAAPVKYWDDRRARHMKFAAFFGIAFVCALAGGGFGLYAALGRLLPEPVSADRLPIGKIAESIVIVTLALWLLRSIARMFFSNLHLGIDSGQRAIMVQTYLSLLREGAGLDAEGKKLMIEAMFRPASTGIVKDDANPPWALAAMFRRGE
ncbi:MAG: hypothetical protein KF678_05760 [Phycisphaeraceae bacterium]|nr:hypothetical protein [Phycisphaeraceae bacterium]